MKKRISSSVQRALMYLCNSVVCVFSMSLTHTQKITVPGAKIKKVQL